MLGNLYDRQKSIKLSHPDKVAIAGCGGIGYWAGLFLSMTGIEHIDLYDPDNIEVHNLNRLPVSSSDIGNPKVEVLRAHILGIRPESRINAFHMRLSASLLSVSPVNLLIDCTDSYKSQVELSDYCKKIGIRYIRCGYNGGGHLTVADKVSKIFVDGATPQNNYEIVPSWVAPAVLVAAMGIMKAVYAESFTFAGEIQNIKGG